jgi:hypothetical protein
VQGSEGKGPITYLYSTAPWSSAQVQAIVTVYSYTTPLHIGLFRSNPIIPELLGLLSKEAVGLTLYHSGQASGNLGRRLWVTTATMI